MNSLHFVLVAWVAKIGILAVLSMIFRLSIKIDRYLVGSKNPCGRDMGGFSAVKDTGDKQLCGIFIGCK